MYSRLVIDLFTYCAIHLVPWTCYWPVYILYYSPKYHGLVIWTCLLIELLFTQNHGLVIDTHSIQTVYLLYLLFTQNHGLVIENCLPITPLACWQTSLYQGLFTYSVMPFQGNASHSIIHPFNYSANIHALLRKCNSFNHSSIQLQIFMPL